MAEKIARIDYKYEIERKIGEGSFSEIYLVGGPTGKCALKLLKEVSSVGGECASEEFKNEFAVLKNLIHPNIARILDFGFDDALQRYYYTSELIEGETIFKATERLSLQEITDLIVQALRALVYLHASRIYHFDIKSANVLVIPGSSPTVKLIDFGLAGIDPRGRLIGTPSYMAPEIIKGEETDWRADLYSLGILWYYCATRRNPFRFRDPNVTLANQLHMIPQPPSTYQKKVPAWMDDIIMRMMAKNPAKRFSHAARVIQEINRFSQGRYPLETRETLISYLPQEGELIGRKKEMRVINGALNELYDERANSKMVLVQGSLGVGKTRLLKEFKNIAQLDDIRVHMANASDGTGYGFWRDALTKHLTDGKELHVFVLDEVEKLAQDERATQQLLSLLYRARRPSGGGRVLLALSCETGKHEEDPLLQALHAAIATQIQLNVFSTEELTEYLASLTGLQNPPPRMVDAIYARTKGNPLFVTEILKALITSGGLFDEGGRWRASVFEDVGLDFSQLTIPNTIEELLLADVALLTDEERDVLEVLAMTERPLSNDELARYTRFANPFKALQSLVQKDLLERTSEHQVGIKNDLLKRTLYASLSDEKRMRYHDHIAQALVEQGLPGEQLQHHLAYGSDVDKASKAARELSEHFIVHNEGRSAIRYIERALQLIPETDVELHVEVLLKYGTALLMTSDYQRAKEKLELVERLLPKLPKSEKAQQLKIEALIRLGGTYLKMNDQDHAREAFLEAKTLLPERDGDGLYEIQIENFLANLLLNQGEYEKARALYAETREKWKRLPQELRLRVSNNDLGMALMGLRRMERAQEVFQEDMRFAEEMGDDRMKSRILYNMAQALMIEKNDVAAAEAYKACVEMCQRSKYVELMLRAYNGLGNLYQMKEDFEQSIDYYERAMSLHQREGEARSGAAISINIGIIENARGNYDAALDALIPSIEFLKDIPNKTAIDWIALGRGLIELGDVERKLGNIDTAMSVLKRAYDLAAEHEMLAKQSVWILGTMAEIEKSRGNEEGLSSLLDDMRSVAQTEDEHSCVQEVEGSLAELRSGVRSAAVLEAERQQQEQEQEREQLRMRAQTRIFEKIVFINKLINEHHPLDDVLKAFVNASLEVSQAHAGAILLLEQGGGFRCEASINMDDQEGHVAFSMRVAERVYRERNAIITRDALGDRRFSSSESISACHLTSIMCLPIRLRGDIIGALYLDDPSSPETFTPLHGELFDAFADQIGMVIENARLVDELSEKELAPHAPVPEREEQGPSILIDEHNAYDPEKSWSDYEKLIVAKAYWENQFNAMRAAEDLGISAATMYLRTHRWKLRDPSQSLYQDPFFYTKGKRLKDYEPEIFQACYQWTGENATKAIERLGVSKGRFYAVMHALRKGKG